MQKVFGMDAGQPCQNKVVFISHLECHMEESLG